MYQQITIVGNVGRDPEIGYTPQGVAHAEFTIAVNKKWGKGAERQEKTTWFRATVWREQAENIGQYVHKGSKIMLVGEIDVNAYIGKDGQAAATLELTVQRYVLLDSKAESENNSSSGGGNKAQTIHHKNPDPKDIPF